MGIWRFGDWENCVTLSGVEVHFMRLGDWEIGRLRCFEHFVTLSGVEVLYKEDLLTLDFITLDFRLFVTLSGVEVLCKEKVIERL